jgi:heme A synthase
MEIGFLKSHRKFAWFAWAVLAYNLPVILWGAFVRVSFSGDGCGDHWPTCNGQMAPTQMAKPMLIEFTHRMMTGLDTFAVIAMCLWAFRAFPKKHAVRRYSVLSLLFLIVEALLGAGLVLFRYVAKDQSAGRAWYLSAHLTNTMLMLACFTITAWLGLNDSARIRLRSMSKTLLAALLTTMFLSITGAIAALGDMLFPVTSLSEGIRQDFSSASSLLVRLRMLHPFIAVFGAVYIVLAAVQTMRSRDEDSPARTAGARVIVLTIFQLALGALNLSLLAPIWMQLIHLAVADLVWVSIIIMACEAVLSRDVSPRFGVNEFRRPPK